jgi:hypothetical protein
MTFNEFKTATDHMVEHHKKVMAAYQLNIDLIDFNNTQNVLINALWNQILTEDGKEWFDWFMYEKGYIEDGKGKRDMKAYDGDKEIVKNLKDLYKDLVTQKYFKCLK